MLVLLASSTVMSVIQIAIVVIVIVACLLADSGNGPAGVAAIVCCQFSVEVEWHCLLTLLASIVLDADDNSNLTFLVMWTVCLISASSQSAQNQLMHQQKSAQH